jgi:hypothetical protein
MKDDTEDGSYPAPGQIQYPPAYPGYAQAVMGSPPPVLPPKPKGHAFRNTIIGLGIVLLLCGGLGVAIVTISAPSVRHSASLDNSGVTSAGSGSPSSSKSSSSGTPKPSGTFFGMPLKSAISHTDTGPTGVLGVEVYKAIREPSCGSYDSAPKGKEILIIDISVKVISGKANINPFDWSFTDSKGNTLDQDMSQCDAHAGVSAFPGDNGLRKGASRNGYVTFVVAKGRGGELTWAPDLEDVASWQIPG